MEFDKHDVKNLKENIKLGKKTVMLNKVSINMNRIAFWLVLVINVIDAVISLKNPSHSNVVCLLINNVCMAICSFQLGTNGLKKQQLKQSQQRLENIQDFLAKTTNTAENDTDQSKK